MQISPCLLPTVGKKGKLKKMILFVFVSGEVEEEPERILPDDFYYDFDDLVSKAFSTEGIPPALLSFQYPFDNHSQYYQV